MVRAFNSDDEGKRVINDNGEEIGSIDRVEKDMAHITPASGLSSQTRQRLGWEEGEASYILEHDTVEDIGDDEVTLKSES